jgi:hypothetical protein
MMAFSVSSMIRPNQLSVFEMLDVLSFDATPTHAISFDEMVTANLVLIAATLRESLGQSVSGLRPR